MSYTKKYEFLSHFPTFVKLDVFCYINIFFLVSDGMTCRSMTLITTKKIYNEDTFSNFMFI